MYILRDEELRLEIIWLYYDTPIAEYKEQQKIVELITRNYWWLEVTKKVKQYVKKCDQCQKITNKAEMPVEKLRPNIVLERLWQYILVDFIVKLLVLRDYGSILVVCDRFSKILYFIVIIEKYSKRIG